MTCLAVCSLGAERATLVVDEDECIYSEFLARAVGKMLVADVSRPNTAKIRARRNGDRPKQDRGHPSAWAMAVVRSRRVRHAGMGGLVQQTGY
jgi:hypothetical protein